MDKNQKTVLMSAIGAVFFLVLIYLAYLIVAQNNTLACPDGTKRVRLNVRAFETQYSVSTLQLGAKLSEDKSFTADLGAKQLQQMSEAVQLARLHMQALADGYNACAISQEQFNKSRDRFQQMEGIAAEINGISGKDKLTTEDQVRLSNLVNEYIQLSH